jgi:membrane associated rhomboid family serine protease
MGGVAWWAHIGGFLVGAALAPLLAPRRPYSSDPFWYQFAQTASVEPGR